jgi:hypothetical protein
LIFLKRETWLLDPSSAWEEGRVIIDISAGDAFSGNQIKHKETGKRSARAMYSQYLSLSLSLSFAKFR